MKGNLYQFLNHEGNLSFFLKKIFKLIHIEDSTMNSTFFGQLLTDLCKNKHVVEFGGGGSTIQISKVAKSIVSVESDKYFAKILRKKLATENTSCEVHILYANIGFTKIYGAPVKFLKPLNSKKYERYTNLYFQNISMYPAVEVLLVDGRFRLATALCFLFRTNHKFLLIFDDYFSRDYYRKLDDFALSAKRFGDVLIAEIDPASIDKKLASQLYNDYKHDSR